jgi:hypothetical protein
MVKIGKREEKQEIRPRVVKDEDQPQQNEKVSGIERMAHQGVRATRTDPELSNVGVTAPSPQAHALAQPTQTDTEHVD